MVAWVGTEPLAVALFDELADRELRALPRARPQTGELPRIHAERARHLDLPRSEPADLLRVRPCLLVVRWTVLCHATTSRYRCRSSTRFRPQASVKEYVNSQAAKIPNCRPRGRYAEPFFSARGPRGAD